MTKRERWVVYPLLLFAIASTVASHFREQAVASFGTVECHRLVVRSPQGIPRIVLKPSEHYRSGVIQIHGPTLEADGHRSVGLNDVQAEIGADDRGGFVRVAGSEGIPFLTLGHQDEVECSGLFATDQHGILFAAPPLSGDPTEPQRLHVRPWGTMLNWHDVPNAVRDYRAAKSRTRPDDQVSIDEPSSAGIDSASKTESSDGSAENQGKDESNGSQIAP